MYEKKIEIQNHPPGDRKGTHVMPFRPKKNFKYPNKKKILKRS